MDSLTPIQQHWVETINLAVFIGTLGLGIIIFLLAVIAVRGLSSWK